LGRAKLAKGDVLGAEPPLELAVSRLVRAPGEEAALGMALVHLADLLEKRGRYTLAEETLRRAIALEEKAGPAHESELGVALSRLASFQIDATRAARDRIDLAQKRIREAKQLVPRAIEIHERAGPEAALAADLRLACQLVRHEKKKARECLERALPLAERAFGASHPEYARQLVDAARFETTDRNPAKASELFEKARSVLERAFGPDHPSLSELYDDWAMSRMSPLAKDGHGIDQEGAIALRKRAEVIEEKHLYAVLSRGTEAEKLAYARTFERGIDRAVSLQRGTYSDGEATRLALRTILRRKGRVLDALSGTLSALRAHDEPEAKRLLAELHDARSALATTVVAGLRGKTAPQYRADVARLSAAADAVEARASAFAASHSPPPAPPVTIEAVQAALPEDGALFEFHRYTTEHSFAGSLYHERTEPKYMLYVLRRTGDPIWIPFFETSAAAIDARVARLRKKLQDPGSEGIRQDLAAMYGLLGRALPKLEGVRRLFISPDGALNLIPFGALVDQDMRHVIERYDISYVTSGRDLLRAPSRGPRRAPPMLVAFPDYDAPGPSAEAALEDRRESPAISRLFFPPIPGTAEEGLAIAPILADPVVTTGPRASEEALAEARGPEILHVATHGFFVDPDGRLARGRTRALELDGPATTNQSAAPGPTETKSKEPIPPPPIDNPLFFSGLALAGANVRHGRAEDGILTAYEASGLDLRGTRLVVLSACETGLGEVDAGEGVHGLRRSFVMAGAETLVMSLWSVDDRATRDLMSMYYKNLYAGAGRSEAMRAAQRAMIRSDASKHPYYWASFIVSGAVTPLEDTAPRPGEAGITAPPGGARGCGCDVAGDMRGGPPWFVFLGTLAALVRRRRRR